MPALDPLAAMDIDRLYRSSAGRLAILVRHEVGGTEAAIEDACQAAWSKLALHRGRVARESAYSWLATTALREALRTVARGERELSLEATLEESASDAVFRLPDEQETESRVVDRMRVQDLQRLSRRQQRLVWLQALGCSHAEIAALSGCTPRTVHRQLHRARRRLRELGA